MVPFLVVEASAPPSGADGGVVAEGNRRVLLYIMTCRAALAWMPSMATRCVEVWLKVDWARAATRATPATIHPFLAASSHPT